MDTQTNPIPHSRIYLLRLWHVIQAERVVWLALLENARKGKPRAFPNAKTLALYLERE